MSLVLVLLASLKSILMFTAHCPGVLASPAVSVAVKVLGGVPVTVTVTIAGAPDASTVFVVPIDARTIREPVPVITVTGSPSVADENIVEEVIGDDISTVLVVSMNARTILEPVPVMTVTGPTVFKVTPWLS